MIKVNVISNNILWKKYFKNAHTYIDKKIKKINLKNKSFQKKNLYLTILLSGNSQIKKLNKKFRNKNKSTDVLSFPFHKKKEFKKKLIKDKEIYLGDIIINLNKIKCKNNKTKFKEEFNKLWVHGFVHLFGYDHKKNKDFYKMLKIEKKYLSYIN